MGFIDRYRERKKPKAQGEPAARNDAQARAGQPSGESKKPAAIRNHIRDAFADTALNPDPRIVTCPEGVVAYKFLAPDPKRPRLGSLLARVFDPDATDNQIREIFAANAEADFEALGPALGIEIISVQKKPVSSSPQEKFIV